MPTKKEVEKFVKSQKSIQFYKKVQIALKEVLLAMPDEDYRKATRNLILMVLHEDASAQVMHFPAMSKFKVLQITFPKNVPLSDLRNTIAHELGHVLQGRNWKKSDGDKLEKDADAYAEKIGFPDTKINKIYREKRRKLLKKAGLD
jgi:Zn-dependent peptidase ImmA (M78 family)